MEKENTTISFMDWKVIMFDHEDVKIVKVIWTISVFFSHVKTKKLVTKKYMKQLKDITYINPINL